MSIEVLTLTIYKDFEIVVTGRFERGESGDRDYPGTNDRFDYISHVADDEDFENYKLDFPNIISHLEDLCLEELTKD